MFLTLSYVVLEHLKDREIGENETESVTAPNSLDELSVVKLFPEANHSVSTFSIQMEQNAHINIYNQLIRDQERKNS